MDSIFLHINFINYKTKMPECEKYMFVMTAARFHLIATHIVVVRRKDILQYQ